MSPTSFRLHFLIALAAFAVLIFDTAQAAQASTLSVAPGCAHVAPGYAHCDAQLLTSHGQLVRPTLPAALTGRTARRAGHVAGTPAPVAGSPLYLQQAYDLTALAATRGAGDTIAVVDASGYPAAESDLAVFRQEWNLPACTTASGCLQIVNQQGQAAPLPAPDGDWTAEESLDLQAASAVCPNCHLILVEADSASSTDFAQAMQAAVNLGADQISDSWSITGNVALPPYSTDFLTPAAGDALPRVIAAAGDKGDDALGTAEYPAALPNVTAVGGTTLTPAASPRGFSESAWSDGGSGCAVGAVPAFQSGTGCAGRAYSDVAADGDPNSGLSVYDSADGGWAIAGGTSLATPIVAAVEALTGVNGSSPAWAYQDAGALNDVVSGSNGACAGLAALLCSVGVGYDGPTGMGSISGDLTTGAPGVAAAPLRGRVQTDLTTVSSTVAVLSGGVYANGEATSYYWQYGTTAAYGKRSAAGAISAGVGVATAGGRLNGLKAATTYHCRLVAANGSGVIPGYDFTFRTARAVTTAHAKATSRVSKTTQNTNEHV